MPTFDQFLKTLPRVPRAQVKLQALWREFRDQLQPGEECRRAEFVAGLAKAGLSLSRVDKYLVVEGVCLPSRKAAR
jgi:hypothetical protein